MHMTAARRGPHDLSGEANSMAAEGGHVARAKGVHETMPCQDIVSRWL